MEENLEEKLARKTKELEIVQRVAVALNASSEVKTIASAMKMNGMLELGYNYVNLGERACRQKPAWLPVNLFPPRHHPDDCWAYDRNVDGTLTWDTDRFPSGLRSATSSS